MGEENGGLELEKRDGIREGRVAGCRRKKGGGGCGGGDR